MAEEPDGLQVSCKDHQGNSAKSFLAIGAWCQGLDLACGDASGPQRASGTERQAKGHFSLLSSHGCPYLLLLCSKKERMEQQG